ALETGLAPDRRNHLYRTERANLAFAAHVIVPSPHTAALLVSEYGVAENRITIAQPGTDQPTGQPNPEDPPLILSVGIQVPRKGHDILLQALAALVDLPWRAVIVGAAYDPLYAEELSQLRCNLNLTDRVHFTGQISDNALTRLYHQATVFALATRHEGYGIVFNEAMAHGLPIISCDVGAVSGTLAPDASLLTPPDDPRAFAQELNRILDDSSLRAGMAEASSRAGRDLPGWDSTARLVDTALTRVCSEARVRG
ncbi:MAG: glycosyltransferase family 4 protein, partial [Pseudomonadota bacterium]